MSVFGEKGSFKHVQVPKSIGRVPYVKIPHVVRIPALQEILFNATPGGNDCTHHVVLNNVLQDLANTTRDHVGSVSQEDGALHLFSGGTESEEDDTSKN